MAAEMVFRLDRVSAAVLDRWYHKAKPGAVALLISNDGPPIQLVRLKDGVTWEANRRSAVTIRWADTALPLWCLTTRGR